MKHLVSFETAKALKEAGYPQPDFETGQVWYTLDGLPHIKLARKWQFLNLESGGIWLLGIDPEKRFYAPSATEIMEHRTMRLCTCDCWGYDPVRWKCADHETKRTTLAESLAEAAAQMFIEKNAKP